MKSIMAIVSGGNITDDFLLSYLEKLQIDHQVYTIAVDKGLEFFCKHQLKPDCMLGDYDSVNPEIYKKFKEMDEILSYTFPPEKDATDTELALDFAIEHGDENTEILIFGGTGTRLDHVLGNLNLLNKALEKKVPCKIIDAYNQICLLDHQRVYTIKKEEQFGKYVSFLPFTDEVCITLEGFVYPLNKGILKRDNSLGISNELKEKEGRIKIDAGLCLCIASRDSYTC